MLSLLLRLNLLSFVFILFLFQSLVLLVLHLFPCLIFFFFQEEVIPFRRSQLFIIDLVFSLKMIQLLFLFGEALFNIIYYLLLELQRFRRQLSFRKQGNIFQIFWKMLDVVQLFEPFSLEGLIDRMLLFYLPQFLRNLSFFDVHDLLVLRRQEKLFSLLLLIGFPFIAQLLLDIAQFLQFLFMDLQSFLLSILNHPLNVSLFLQEAVIVIGVLLLDLMEPIQVEFVVRIIVVVLLLEAILALTFIGLFSHQQ